MFSMLSSCPSKPAAKAMGAIVYKHTSPTPNEGLPANGLLWRSTTPPQGAQIRVVSVLDYAITFAQVPVADLAVAGTASQTQSAPAYVPETLLYKSECRVQMSCGDWVTAAYQTGLLGEIAFRPDSLIRTLP